MVSTSAKRDEFVQQNLGLVHSCAHRFKGRGIEYDDLFSAGAMGLVKAYDSFDENRGFQFSTYAVPVILGEMRRLFRDGGTVKVSRSLKDLSLKASRMREKFLLEHYREPTTSELAQLLEVSNEEAAMAISASLPALSLTETDEDGGGQLDIAVASDDDKLTDLISLKLVVGELEINDRKLIALRYFNNKTQSQTANALGMTQVQVSRREKKILCFLKERLSS